jgi:uncharacterized protein YcaQ
MALELSASQARVLSLRQVGVDSDRDDSVMAVVDRLGLLQVDSVNVFERAHYMPLFSRLGKFDKSELESAMGGFHPQLIEYWAHEASIVRIENWPLYRWRMNAYRDMYSTKWGMEAGNKKLVEQITSQLRANGPMTTGQFETEANVRKGSWWGWSDLKQALEYMFLVGDLVSGGRDSFKRLYALPEQVIPQRILDHTPSDSDAKKKLFLQAATATGVGTYTDIADWHRMSPTTNKKIFAELVESGELLEVQVDGWAQPGFINASTSLEGLDAKAPGARTTILSPFDPVCWKRDRIERMFGFEYRIEIYTPEPKRQFGYYTLPILHNRDLVGRIDLKSDRHGRQLLAQASWHEAKLADRQVASLAKELKRHLKEVQSWQGLNETVVIQKGNLAELLG